MPCQLSAVKSGEDAEFQELWEQSKKCQSWKLALEGRLSREGELLHEPEDQSSEPHKEVGHSH